MTIKEISGDKLAWLNELTLAKGKHQANEGQYCFNEAAAYLAGQPHSDMPPCVSQAIRKFTMRLNDKWDDTRRQQLKPYIVPALGTNTGRIEDEQRRAFIVTDWSCRVLLPMLFEFRGWAEWSTRLRELPEVVNKDTAIQARDLVREARTFAYAAYAADAAYAAADAAYAADAAAYAAYAADAAAYAAADAADAAAYAAADAKRDFIERVDASALECLERLIEVGCA